MLKTIVKGLRQGATRTAALSSASVVFMMMLTCSDIALRLFGRPIPGTYELVGYAGAVMVAFALAYTAVERGHIAVELLVDKLPRRARLVIEGLGALVSSVLFSLLAWQSALSALDLIETGEVSLTLGVPVYPFVFCLSAGTLFLSITLFIQFLQDLKGAAQR